MTNNQKIISSFRSVLKKKDVINNNFQVFSQDHQASADITYTNNKYRTRTMVEGTQLI